MKEIKTNFGNLYIEVSIESDDEWVLLNEESKVIGWVDKKEWEENEDFLTTTTDWNKFIDILFCELLGTDVSWGSSKKELMEQVDEYMTPNGYKTNKKAVKRDMFKFGKLYMLIDVGDYYDGTYENL